MRWITEILFFLFRQFLYREAANQAKKEGLLFYLKALQTIRKSMMGTLALVFAFQLIVFGFVGAIATAIFLLPLEPDFKLWLLFGVFTALFVVPVLILAIVLSEKMWFRLSGAEKMMSDMTNPTQSSEHFPRAS